MKITPGTLPACNDQNLLSSRETPAPGRLRSPVYAAGGEQNTPLSRLKYSRSPDVPDLIGLTYLPQASPPVPAASACQAASGSASLSTAPPRPHWQPQLNELQQLEDTLADLLVRFMSGRLLGN